MVQADARKLYNPADRMNERKPRRRWWLAGIGTLGALAAARMVRKRRHR